MNELWPLRSRSPLVAGRRRGLVSCGYGSRLVLGRSWAFSDVGLGPSVSHFEIMCRVLGHQPSLGTFRRFFVNSYSNGWLSFSKRAFVPCCTSKPLDSLKRWNDHFFWIDASIYLIFVPWYNDVSVKKDPLPSDDIVDFELLEKLDNNCTLIRKYPETFLCLVGLSHSFFDPISRPTLLRCDKSDIGLLDFVKSSDTSKIKTKERTLALGEVPLLTETIDMVVNPSLQMIRLVTHTISNEINAHSGKNKRKIGASVGLLPVKKSRMGGVSINEPTANTVGKFLAVIKKIINQANVDFRVAASRPEEFVSSFVTPTLEHDYEDESVSNHDDNVVPIVLSVQTNADIVTTEPLDETHGSSVPRTEVGGPSVPKNATGTSSAIPDQCSHVDDFYDSETIDSAAS
nr:putative transposase (putative), gypsy type [Tanacetum cinerariifolium]